jgi:hypothetical protein
LDNRQFWLDAADDLGLEVVSPFELALLTGARIGAIALVRRFGPANGMLIIEDFELVRDHTDALRRESYGYSTFDEGQLGNYERRAAIEMLSDWGWSGDPEQAPSWIQVAEDDEPSAAHRHRS